MIVHYHRLSNFGLLAAFIVILSSWMYMFGVRKTPIVVGTRVLSQLHTALALSAGRATCSSLLHCDEPV